MAANDIEMKVGDTAPTVFGTLKDATDAPVDIAGATLRFLIGTKPKGATPAQTVVDAEATNMQVNDGSDGSKGKWSYAWQDGDVAEKGQFFAEIEVTFAAGKVQTYPTVSYLSVNFTDDLGGTA